jgi:hypothetical protein
MTIVEAQTRTWDTKEDMEKEFKRSGLRLLGADHMPGQNAEGKWCLIDRPLPDDEGSNVVRIEAAKKKKAAAPTAKKAPAPKKAVRKAAEASPKPEEVEPGEYRGPEIKGGPSLSKLPAGFVDWAVEQSRRPQGVSRKELSDHTGQTSAKWFAYLRGIAEANNLKCRMAKRERYNCFWME